MSFLGNLKASTKLGIDFLIVIILMCTIGFLGFNSMSKLNTSGEKLYYNSIVGISSISDIDKNTIQVYLNSKLMLSSTEKDKINELSEYINTLNSETATAIKAYKSGIVSEENRSKFSNLENTLKEYETNINQFLSLMSQNNIPTAIEKFKTIENLKLHLTDSINELDDLNDTWAKKNITNNESLFKSSTNIIIVVIILALLISGILRILMLKSITVPLNKTKDLAERLSNYDFSTPLDIHTKDEFGIVAMSLNTSQRNVANLIETLTTNSENMSASSEELSATVEEISSKFSFINEKTSEINSTFQEASSSSEEIAASSQEIDSSVAILAKKATEGSTNAIDIKNRAIKIKSNTQTSFNNASKLYKDAEKSILEDIEKGKIVDNIKAMADTIASISEQTNLLSLNAAIEAARAGESGRGFSVVADEVRRLAEQSASEVVNVKNTISDVQDAFKSLSDNSNNLLSFISNDIIPQFEEFLKVSEQYQSDGDFISEMSEDLASMAQELSATVNQVSEAIHHLSNTTEESSHSLQDINSSINESTTAISQVACTAENQASQAHDLSLLIEKFTI